MHFSGSTFWLWHSWNIPRHLVATDNGWCSLRSATFSRFCLMGVNLQIRWRPSCWNKGSEPADTLSHRENTAVKTSNSCTVAFPSAPSFIWWETGRESVCIDNEHQWTEGFKTTNSEIKWPKKCDKDILLTVHCVIMFPATHSVTCIVSKLLCIHLEAAVMDLLLQCFKCLSVLTTCTNSLGFVPLSHGSQISEAAQLWSLYAMNEPHTCKLQSMQACNIPQGKLSFHQNFIHCVTSH